MSSGLHTPGESRVRILIGPAGWSYKDWEGVVYPPGLKKKEHPAAYLARYFDTIEINTSFYGHIRPELGKLWCRKVSETNPDFLFTAKLHRSFTHSPHAEVESTTASTIAPGAEDESLARQGLDSIAAEGRLGALLIQFPFSFKNTNENRDYLEGLLGRFREYPQVVEVRHSSWNNEGILRYFSERGVAFCNIDQPLIGRSLKPTAHATSKLGYIRLHGRNYDQWFDSPTGADRYNYLYSDAELAGWEKKIRSVAAKTDLVFVIANNHFEGKATVNALQLKHSFTGQPVAAPETLVRHYPELETIAQPPPDSLFRNRA
ncbi:MAG TPA: DUF72 domain-containing protein [Terriglobales bacterium]|nr:DUF72 domain-containing protein [Terriglobales bacterium]